MIASSLGRLIVDLGGNIEFPAGMEFIADMSAQVVSWFRIARRFWRRPNRHRSPIPNTHLPQHFIGRVH